MESPLEWSRRADARWPFFRASGRRLDEFSRGLHPFVSFVPCDTPVEVNAPNRHPILDRLLARAEHHSVTRDHLDDSSALECSMRMRRSRFPRARMAAAAAALFVGSAALPLAAGAGPAVAVAAAATSAATVSVSAGQTLATVPSTAIGTNGSVYDAALTDAAVPGLLKNAGTGLIRFPGGTSSDTYNWKHNTDVTSGLAQ